MTFRLSPVPHNYFSSVCLRSLSFAISPFHPRAADPTLALCSSQSPQSPSTPPRCAWVSPHASVAGFLPTQLSSPPHSLPRCPGWLCAWGRPALPSPRHCPPLGTASCLRRDSPIPAHRLPPSPCSCRWGLLGHR